MSIFDSATAWVDAVPASTRLSQMFSLTPAAGNPAYLVVSALDRNEYTAGASGATGSLSGNGHSLSLKSICGDTSGAGIVFTWQASTGSYINPIYGNFSALTYMASGSAGDVTDLSVFGAATLGTASAYAANPYSLMELDATGYLGTATVMTQHGFTGAVPAQATPDSIAAIAQGFVGQAWNQDGCWVLCSTIAADAGAALPMQSTVIGLAGQANGEWIVAYNGPAGQTGNGQSGNWQSMVTAGEMVVIGNPGGGGHITTVVSGAGATAMVVDNAAFEAGSGAMLNAANDGSANDIVIQAAHPASQEFAGVQSNAVVIYELDTPVVTTKVASASLAAGASQSLATLFAATDPAGKPITSWQVYNSAATDVLVSAGVSHSANHSAATALTVGSLASVSLLAGAAAATDTLEVRAYNGAFWGDWQKLTVAVAAAPAKPAITVTPTASQTWTDGETVSCQVSPATFADGLKLPMTFAAFQVGGANASSWLHFNAATDTLSGTVPAAASGSIAFSITATDSLHLTAADLFNVTFATAAQHTIPVGASTPSGMGLLFTPPEPVQAFAFHS